MYVYERGEMIVALTNSYDNQKAQVTVEKEIKDAEELCSVFNHKDCQTVKNRKISIELNDGEFKIYIPKKLLLNSEVDNNPFGDK